MGTEAPRGTYDLPCNPFEEEWDCTYHHGDTRKDGYFGKETEMTEECNWKNTFEYIEKGGLGRTYEAEKVDEDNNEVDWQGINEYLEKVDEETREWEQKCLINPVTGEMEERTESKEMETREHTWVAILR